MPDPFTYAETTKILEYLAKQRHEQILNYYEFKFWTGLRTGEALALEWSDVDREGGVVSISKALVNGKKATTKTHRERLVQLNVRASTALTRQQQWTEKHGGRIFYDPDTNLPWENYNRVTEQHWIPVLKKLGIRYRTPYATRHTYATMCIMAGMTPGYIAAQLGHSVEVLFKYYARWLYGERDKRELAKIEELLLISPSVSPEKQNE